MKKNIGTIDMVVRLLLALVIIVLYFVFAFSGTVGILLLIVAGLLILTSILGICPAYLPFRVNTRKKEEKK
jgi:fatty acid desaturase